MIVIRSLQRRMFSRWLSLVFAVISGLTITTLHAEPPAPAPDFFRMDYGPLLPAIPEGAANVLPSGFNAVSTGDGGWLIHWFDQDAGGNSTQLKARLLPPAFDSPPSGSIENWTGMAAPPVSLSTLNLNKSAAAAPGGVAPGFSGLMKRVCGPGGSIRLLAVLPAIL